LLARGQAERPQPLPRDAPVGHAPESEALAGVATPVAPRERGDHRPAAGAPGEQERPVDVEEEDDRLHGCAGERAAPEHGLQAT
jgi:hypothetical protein